MANHTLELTRHLFLFSYSCYGISFIDAALLIKKNIIRYNTDNYIICKRNKTKEAKKVKLIQIKVTPEIQSHLDWFAENTVFHHTMVMTLQDNQAPREIISQILGHSDLATTNTYLDNFSSSIIDETVKVL
jgi:site-specific recombinase XerD